MMLHRIASLIAVALWSAAITGCGSSAQSHFYTLDSTAIANTATPVRTAVIVGEVSVPASVDQPGLVVQVAPNRVEVEEFDRWAAPLDESIARAVAGDLRTLLATPSVTSAPLANFQAAYVVTINIQRFESVKGNSALVDAIWSVRTVASGKTWSGHTIAEEPAQGEGFDALAAAHSRAIAKLSGDIADSIRSNERASA